MTADNHGARRDHVKLAAEAERNGWRGSPDPDGVTLTEAEREALAKNLRWHFNCHAAEPDKSYASLGIENAVLAVERVLAAHLRAVEAERDKWKGRWERYRVMYRERFNGGLSNAEWHRQNCAAFVRAERAEADLAAESAAHEATRARVAALHVEAYPGAGWCKGCHDAHAAETWPCPTAALLDADTAGNPDSHEWLGMGR